MPITDIGLTMLDGAWTVSTYLLPVFTVLLVAWGVYRERTSVRAVLRFAFDDAAPRSGEYVVFTVSAAGVVHYLVDVVWAAALLPVAGMTWFFIRNRGLAGSSHVPGVVKTGFYLVVATVAAAATVTMHGLTAHVAAVLFYAVLFWEL